MSEYCYHCDKRIMDEDDRHEIIIHGENRVYCSKCILLREKHLYECSICGKLYDFGYDRCHYVDDKKVCLECIKKIYKTCNRCGNYKQPEQLTLYKERWLCSDCIRKMESTPIPSTTPGGYHEPCHRDSIEFFGDSKDGPYLGIELEIDGGNYASELVEFIAEQFPKNFIVFEDDGSLDDGIECITRPATLVFHKEYEESYKKWFKTATRLPYHFLSHKTNTCGLHIHFNRSYFDTDFTSPTSDACITRLLYLVEKFWDNLVIFSRRTNNGLRWCRRYNISEEEVEEIVKKQPIKGGSLDRYSAINLTNNSTIEFRLFRGTMNLDTFFATLELVNNLITLAKHTTDFEVLRRMEFTELLTNERMVKYWERAKERKSNASHS